MSSRESKQSASNVISAEERWLLKRAQKLDQAALAEIHDRYYPLIYKYMLIRIEDVQLAEDLTSEVFLRLLEAFQDNHKKAPQQTIKGWLFGVASRVVKEHFRYKKRTPHIELSEKIASNERSPDKHLDDQLLFESLMNNLSTLNDEQRDVLALRFGFEMPFRHVAVAMGKNEGAVKMIQARAIQTLSRKLLLERGAS